MRYRGLTTAGVLLGLLGIAFGQQPPTPTPAPTPAPMTPAQPPMTTPMTTPTPAAGGLAWQFKVGVPFFQQMFTRTEQTLTVMGQDVIQNQEQTFWFKFTPVKNEGGKWVIEQEIEGVKMTIDINMNKIEYDSTAGAGSSNPALTDFFSQLKGTKFEIKLGADGKVESVSGRNEFVNKLSAVNPNMKQLLDAILTDDTLKQMVDQTFGILPTKAPAVGETWKKDVELKLGPIGTYKNSYTYSYKGKDAEKKNLDRIEVENSFSYTPPTAQAGEGLPFKILKATFDPAQKSKPGVLLFDSTKGRLESTTQEVKLVGELEIEITTQPAKVKLNQTQKTTVTTADTSLLPQQKAK